MTPRGALSFVPAVGDPSLLLRVIATLRVALLAGACFRRVAKRDGMAPLLFIDNICTTAITSLALYDTLLRVHQAPFLLPDLPLRGASVT